MKATAFATTSDGQTDGKKATPSLVTQASWIWRGRSFLFLSLSFSSVPRTAPFFLSLPPPPPPPPPPHPPPHPCPRPPLSSPPLPPPPLELPPTLTMDRTRKKAISCSRKGTRRSGIDRSRAQPKITTPWVCFQQLAGLVFSFPFSLSERPYFSCSGFARDFSGPLRGTPHSALRA